MAPAAQTSSMPCTLVFNTFLHNDQGSVVVEGAGGPEARPRWL